jgi:mutator protein MutT
MGQPADAILVAGALIVREGRVLLGRRAPHKRICPDTWDLIGGHVEAGETLEQGLVRELAEEIDIRPTRFAEIAEIDFSQEAGRLVLYHMFRIDAFDGEPRLANPEHVALRWFGWAEALALPDLASDRYRPIMGAEAARERGR